MTVLILQKIRKAANERTAFPVHLHCATTQTFNIINSSSFQRSQSLPRFTQRLSDLSLLCHTTCLTRCLGADFAFGERRALQAARFAEGFVQRSHHSLATLCPRHATNQNTAKRLHCDWLDMPIFCPNHGLASQTGNDFPNMWLSSANPRGALVRLAVCSALSGRVCGNPSDHVCGRNLR